MITTQLNHERVGLAAWSGLAISLYEDIVDWAAAQPTDDGKTLIDQAWVQMDLAKCHAELEAMWLLNWRMAVHVADGELTGAESSSIKVFGTERIIEVTRLLLGIVGAAGYLVPGSPGAVLRGRVEATGRQAQINTFGGGVNEVPARDRGHGRAGHDPGGAVTLRLGPGRAGSGALRGAGAVPGPQCRAGGAGGPGGRPAQPGARRGQRADDPPLGRGHGRPQPGLRVRRRCSCCRLRRADRPADHAPGLDHARPARLAAHRGGPGPGVPGEQGSGPNEQMMGLLDDEGLTSVVATNCEQSYGRPLVVGDRLLVRSVIEAISDPKRTGLGTGRFITTRLDYVAVPDADVPVWTETRRRCRRSTTPASRWPPCASASSSTCRRVQHGGPPAPPAAGHHAGQRVLVRGRPRPHAAHSALHVVRHAAPPTAAGLRRLRLPRVGHRRVERPRHALLLRRRALPPGAGVRVPAADRPDRAGRGDAGGRQPRGHGARRH